MAAQTIEVPDDAQLTQYGEAIGGSPGFHSRLRAEGRAARLVLQVHDELLFEVPDVELSAIKDLVRQEMCGAYALEPPLAVDIGVGDDWNEAKS